MLPRPRICVTIGRVRSVSLRWRHLPVRGHSATTKAVPVGPAVLGVAKLTDKARGRHCLLKRTKMYHNVSKIKPTRICNSSRNIWLDMSIFLVGACLVF